MILTAHTATGADLTVNDGTLSAATATYRHPPLIPNDVRMRGVNIAPKFSWVDTPDGGSVWPAMWRVWDWAGTLQPQIDDAATIANCVRMFGNTYAVTSGNITQTQYLTRWEQFLDYCVTKNLYVYPCGGDLYSWGHDTTYTAAAGLYTAWAELLSGYNNIIGVDITNEPWGRAGGGSIGYDEPENYLDLLHNLSRIVRNHGIPVTHSFSLYTAELWDRSDNALLQQFYMCDFIDLHIYVESPTAEQVAAYMARPWCQGKQLLIGEFGGLDPGASGWVARYTDIQDIVEADAAYCGALAWTCWDLGTDPGTLSGLFDASRDLRTDISDPFATLPITR